MTGRADRWIRLTTTSCVTILALIAGTVSYLHMHALVALHGQPGWVAALTPLSVDRMIVAASTTLLAESRAGSRGGAVPWALLAIGSVASLAANVVVAEPTAIGRVIGAWPSFALIGSYELSPRILSPLHDLVPEAWRKRFATCLSQCGARYRRCSEAQPVKTHDMCNSPVGYDEYLIMTQPARIDRTSHLQRSHPRE